MKNNNNSGLRLFFKSFLISLSVVLPLCLIVYFVYIGGDDEKPAGFTAENIPVTAESGNLFVAVCDNSGDRLMFAAALRFDTDKNLIVFTVIPASSLPEPSGGVIVRGGTPSSYMDSCISGVSEKYNAPFPFYAALTLSDLGKMLSALGDFRYNVTVPIRADGENGLTEFRLECGDTHVNGDTAAAILKYSSALPEKDYIPVVASLTESALQRFLETGFSENAVNCFYSMNDRIASNLGSYEINRLYRAILVLESNGAAVRYLPLEGTYGDGGFESDASLAQSFS